MKLPIIICVDERNGEILFTADEGTASTADPKLVESIPSDELEKIKNWLGNSGIDFFNEMRDKYNSVCPAFVKDGIPHSVHFREGMRVRNFLRELDYFKDWTCHQLDDNWTLIIEKIIEQPNKST